MVRLLLLCGILLCLSGPSGNKLTKSERRKIFVGVDGVSREEFVFAREKLGLFQTLKFNTTHISPFPSISDYSWNVMVGARKVMGRRGRIRTYEAAHFDRERNELVSDPREYFRRLGEEHHYFTGAFEHWLNPYVESLLYIPTEELPRLELKQLLSSIKEDKRKLVTVMVASSDALAHTRADGSKFLVELDKFVLDLERHYKNEGEDVEIILASDHGQASRFHPGEKPEALIGVELKGVLSRAGLHSVRKLASDQDVVFPVMALANYGTAFFQQTEKRAKFIEELKKEKWFSTALFRSSIEPGKIRLSIVDKTGTANLTIRKEQEYSYLYELVNSNPLGIAQEYQGRWLSDKEARLAASGTSFPDSLYRIAFSAFEEEAEFPDLIFTLHDEYFVAGEFNSFTTMFQTHGSLGRRSSSGILASTHPLKFSATELRTHEILPAVGIHPRDMFESTSRGHYSAPAGRLATGSEDWSNRRIFALMNRAVQDSRYVFEEKSLDVILGVVKPLLDKNAPPMPAVNWKESLNTGDLAYLLDLMIRDGKVETIKNDPRFLEMKTKLAAVNNDQKRLPSAEVHHGHHSPDLVRKGDAAKKLVMKSYSSMFLLEKALTIPEMPFITDSRDIAIDKNDVKKIFSEIFHERSLLAEIYPAKFATHWDATLPPENMTIVYVPGIYNSLFDDEIFRKGLDHLKNKWGVRVLSPQVFSTCSSVVNGKLILEEMKKDLHAQKELGRPVPRYFVLGYSKGGVDSLHGFASDPEFVSAHVAGLLTIASPIKGSSILDKTDLPLEIMDLLGNEKAPEICRTEEKAASSVTPAGAQAFLRKNASKLVGLTRYYSLSFVSELKKSHLFMRATKNIGRFGEPNDGVVALSASTFPEEFGAVDLGVVEADHLAGIVASHFPHDAFMESVLFTMGHLKSFDHSRNEILNERIAYAAKKTDPERHRQFLSGKIGTLTSKIFGNSDLEVLSQSIRTALSGTSYELKPFSLVRKKGKVHVSFREGRWPSVAGGSSVEVKDSEELNSLFLTSLQASGKNLLKTSRFVVPESNRTPMIPPKNELGYHEDLRIKVRDLDKFISGKKVIPVSHISHPQGFSFVYDHASSSEFRNEYQLSFEDCTPADADDNQQSGWETVIMGDKVWGKLASTNSSIRLSTYSWRFLARDFPDLGLEIQVNDDVDGADVLYGGNGKDDSAFQLWFTFRILDDKKNREYLHHEEKMMTIGYYFGDEIPGKDLQLNSIYKNYYSEKDFVIAKLPAARQKLIGLGKGMLGKVISSQHNLLEDIRASYPDVDPTKAEIVAITIQHDSNDTKGKSEAYFRSLELKPRLNRTVKVD